MISQIVAVREIAGKLLFILDRQQKKYGMLLLICSLIGAAFEVLGVGIIVPLVSAFMNADQLLENQWIKIPAKWLRIKNSNQLVLFITLVVIFVFLIKNIYFVLLSWIRVKYSCKVSRELSSRMIKIYMKRGYEFFLSTNTSDLSRNINGDVSGVNTMLTQILRALIDILTIVLIVVYIMMTDWTMAIAVAVLSLICLLLIYGVFRKKMRKAGEMFSKYSALVNKYLLEALHGIKEILVKNKQEYFVENFDKANIQRQKATIRQTVGAESPAYIIEGICVSGLLGTICMRLMFGSEDALALVPALASFAVGAFRILPSLGRISSALNTALYYIPSLNRVYDNLNEIIRYDANRIVLEKEGTEDIIPILKFNKEIKLENIDWKYQNKENEVISGLNLTIKKGQSVALVGASGAGKTTLADIILGLLHPQGGKILVDGRDIADVNGNVSHIMGYVPQSVYLTDDTVRNNVAFGIAPMDIDDNRVWKALEEAQLKEFVENLKNGLDTMVGDRGIRFSGGQRQRIAIARALYESPDILVFDEATASLDNETEAAVMESIKKLQGHKTLIIIAHRLSTIKDCEMIYALENGKAVKKIYEEISN